MALLTYSKIITAASAAKGSILKTGIRTLLSKQLVYTEFGEPTQVVKLRECSVPPLGCQDVLVRMLAAPVNPADINTIQGKNSCMPHLPTIPGDEGVGEVVEIGNKVSLLKPGDRVILICRMQGTWRYYGVFNEQSLHKISPNLSLAEASMLSISPSAAFRMIKDFREMHSGETVMQNAANSPIGQCIIQLCKHYGLKTLNIVANHCEYEAVKEHLLQIGATKVCTLEEAEQVVHFDTSMARPTLAFNCLGGRYEDVLLRLLDCYGTIVYYGCAYDLPMVKHFIRSDLAFHKFHYGLWSASADPIIKTKMFKKLTELMVIGKLRAPIYKPVELKNYIFALRNTVSCEAFSIQNYVFDLTLP